MLEPGARQHGMAPGCHLSPTHKPRAPPRKQRRPHETVPQARRLLPLAPHRPRRAGLSYETENVDLATKKTASGGNFFEVNPKGYVPALLLDSGELLTEGPAIVQYIADQAPPESSPRQRQPGPLPVPGLAQLHRHRDPQVLHPLLHPSPRTTGRAPPAPTSTAASAWSTSTSPTSPT
jgi:hypothetical protein